MVTSTLVLASQIRKYLKNTNLNLKLRVVKGIFILDNLSTDSFWDCRDLCQDATGIKFESITNSMAQPAMELVSKKTYTQKEVMNASYLQTRGKQIADKNLANISQWCWRYVEFHSNSQTALWYINDLWKKAISHVESNSYFFERNIIPQ